MDFDASREGDSMDVDDAPLTFSVSRRHRDTVMNAPDSSSDGIQLSGSVDASIQSLPGPLLSPSSPSRHHHLGGMDTSARGISPRKRKHSDGSSSPSDPRPSQEDRAFADGSNSRRRTRPRLQKQRPQNREFSPLLIVSPRPDSPEEEISAFRYTSIVASSSRSAALYPETPRDSDPNALPDSASLGEGIDRENRAQRRRRSDSTASFAEVAMASTSTESSKHSDLSSLSDFGLPRPFEEPEQACVGSINVVHERGLDAPPPFFSNHGRAGGSRASRESTHGLDLIEFFDRPRCDSPDPIDDH